MSFTLTDLLDNARGDRDLFLQHVKGASDDVWSWKPYPGCKNIRETFVHIIGGQRLALDSFGGADFPDFEIYFAGVEAELENDTNEQLVAKLTRATEDMYAHLEATYGDKPLDTELALWGKQYKLGILGAIASNEFQYHAGQVAFIRMAADPSWDYYAAIYSH